MFQAHGNKYVSFFVLGSLSLAERLGNWTACGDSHHSFSKAIPLHVSIYQSGFCCFFLFYKTEFVFFNTSTGKPDGEVSPKCVTAGVVSLKLLEVDLLN